VSSSEPVKNGCEVIYEMFHIIIELRILNPVEVLTFSGFYTQLLKLCS